MVMKDRRKIRLGILFGGRSGEHEVSLTSAASVISALNPDKYEITAIGITKEGRLANADEVRRMLPAHILKRIDAGDSLQAGETGMKVTSCTAARRAPSHSLPDIIFPLLHGPYGEDGTIQGLFEIAGLPYIGCGVLASAVGMDKDVMKRLFVEAGLPTLPFKVFMSREANKRTDAVRRVVEKEFGYPLFSKPANLGSSVGVCKIHSAQEFAEAVRYSTQFDRKILIEKGIEARELECAVLGNDDPKASAVGEVHPSREFYDYYAKYSDPDSRTEIPARLPKETAEEVREIAMRAFRCIDGSGLARVDFFLEKNTGALWLNEINTMPGFTPISMYPKLWAASGIAFGDLVDQLIELGLERHRERNKRRISGEL
jgi:D-alanine-D-alanine ligase